MPENIASPGGTAELVGIGLALLILFLAFGSFVAAGLPIGVALVGLGIGSGGVTLLAALTDVTTIAPTLASMIGIGVGVDYALFIVTRHRDALARGLSVPDAAAEATATAGQSVVLRRRHRAAGAVRPALHRRTELPGHGLRPRASSCCSSWPPRSPCCRRCSAWPGCGSTAARPAAPRTSRRPRRTRRPPPGCAHAVAGRPVAWMVGSTGAAARARGAGAGHEARQRRRGQRGRVDHDPPGLRPGRRRLRARAPTRRCWSRMDVDEGRRPGRHRRADRRARRDPRGRRRVAGPAVPRRLGGGGHRHADPRAAGRRDHRAARPGPGRAARRAPSSAASPRA